MKDMRKIRGYKEILILSVFSFVLLGVGFLSNDVHAEESEDEVAKKGVPQGGIQVSPTKFIWTLNEGTSKVEKVNVKNYSDIEQRVTVEVEDFFVGSDGMEPKFFVPDDSHPLKARDIIDWIVPPEDFTLAPGEGKWVEFRVAIPQGQPTNGYYGGILFKTGGLADGDGSRIGLSYRIGALIIMAVQGDEPMKIEGTLNEFYSEKKLYWESPSTLIIKTNNTGNIHYPMFGNIAIKKFDKKFHVIELQPQLVYPDIEKIYTEKMLSGWWDFGKYTADLEMWSEDKQVQFNAQTEFYVIPWRGLAVIAGGIFGLLLVSWLFKKYVHIGSKPKKVKKKK